MLQAELTFPGTGALGAVQPSSYFGNEMAIEAVSVNKTAVGQYTVTFLSGRDLKVTQPPAVNITAQDNTGTSFITQLLKPVQFTFNANAQDYKWQLQLQIVCQKINPSVNILVLGSYPVLAAADPLRVMLTIAQENDNYKQNKLDRTLFDKLLETAKTLPFEEVEDEKQLGELASLAYARQFKENFKLLTMINRKNELKGENPERTF